MIGSSDVATLILVGCKDEEGIITQQLHFGEDGNYLAYVIQGVNVEIGKHYKKVATFTHWLRIYDDVEKTFDQNAKEINIYRAGNFGCIIQIIQ